MFGEQIATITRDHAKEHLRAYLDAINAIHDSPVTLTLPKSFEVSTILGGVAGVAGKETLPALAISAGPKTPDTSNENDLYSYIYSGQISGMVAGSDSANVEKIANRYAAALEAFIREHHFMPHDANLSVSGLPFLITEMTFISYTPMGAAAIQDEKGKTRMWVDGFRHNLFWRVSESGPGQHDG